MRGYFLIPKHSQVCFNSLVTALLDSLGSSNAFLFAFRIDTPVHLSCFIIQNNGVLFKVFGFRREHDVRLVTLQELRLLIQALKFRWLDEKFKAYHQALLNHMAQATDQRGQYVYTDFQKFFDYEKELKQLEKASGQDEAADRLLAIAILQAEYQREKEEEDGRKRQR